MCTNSKSNSDQSHCLKMQHYVNSKYRRARSDGGSEDDIPLAKLKEKNQSRQNRIHEEQKYIPIDSEDSTNSYFSGSEEMEVGDTSCPI